MIVPSGEISVGNLLMMKQQKSVPINSRLQNVSLDENIQKEEDTERDQNETSFDYNWDDDGR